MKRIFNFILTLTAMLTMAQGAWAQEAAVYDLVTEVPTIDGGQSTNWNTEYDYYSLVDGDTYTVYGISNANPWVEFHYSRAFVPKKYILWTGDSWSFAYNPATWTIKAKLNKTDEWTTLATVDNSNGDLLDPAEDQLVLDYYDCLINTMADFLLEMADAAKQRYIPTWRITVQGGNRKDGSDVEDV